MTNRDFELDLKLARDTMTIEELSDGWRKCSYEVRGRGIVTWYEKGDTRLTPQVAWGLLKEREDKESE
jgi:hypothetical protein